MVESTVWMVNSTAQGGGVAEMLPKVVTLLRASGVNTGGPSSVRLRSVSSR